MKWTTLGLCFALALMSSLGGCALNPFDKKEMPIAPDGVDKMRKSPCACTEIEYRAPTFEWVENA